MARLLTADELREISRIRWSHAEKATRQLAANLVEAIQATGGGKKAIEEALARAYKWGQDEQRSRQDQGQAFKAAMLD